jgi:hypothetical protein
VLRVSVRRPIEKQVVRAQLEDRAMRGDGQEQSADAQPAMGIAAQPARERALGQAAVPCLERLAARPQRAQEGAPRVERVVPEHGHEPAQAGPGVRLAEVQDLEAGQAGAAPRPAAVGPAGGGVGRDDEAALVSRVAHDRLGLAVETPRQRAGSQDERVPGVGGLLHADQHEHALAVAGHRLVAPVVRDDHEVEAGLARLPRDAVDVAAGVLGVRAVHGHGQEGNDGPRRARPAPGAMGRRRRQRGRHGQEGNDRPRLHAHRRDAINCAECPGARADSRT